MDDMDESENILWNISGFRASKSYDATPLLLEPPNSDESCLILYKYSYNLLNLDNMDKNIF